MAIQLSTFEGRRSITIDIKRFAHCIDTDDIS